MCSNVSSKGLLQHSSNANGFELYIPLSNFNVLHEFKANKPEQRQDKSLNLSRAANEAATEDLTSLSSAQTA